MSIYDWLGLVAIMILMINDWYGKLKKPSWAPPEELFGQVWSILYLIIFAVNIYVFTLLSSGKIDWKIALPFWINLAANFLFTPLQFSLRNNYLALIDIVIILVTIVWAIIAIWSTSKFASLAFIPYLIWVCIATTLQASITWLNR